MSGVREVTIRGPVERAFTAHIDENGRTEVAVEHLGGTIAFGRFSSPDAAKRAALAWIDAVEDEERANAVSRYVGRAS